jgi:hypothetical protein
MKNLQETLTLFLHGPSATRARRLTIALLVSGATLWGADAVRRSSGWVGMVNRTLNAHELDIRSAVVIASTDRKAMEMVIHRLEALEQRTVDQYRDALSFQADIYKALGETKKSKSVRDKAEALQ